MLLERFLLRNLGRDNRGLAMVEFAFTLPILTALSLGVYDVSRLVMQRLDLQQASTEIAGLIMANPPEDSTTYIRDAAATASGLPTNKVSVTTTLQCNGANAPSGTVKCSSGQEQARYVTVVFTGTYTPMWTRLGLSHTKTLPITRTVRTQ